MTKRSARNGTVIALKHEIVKHKIVLERELRFSATIQGFGGDWEIRVE